MRKRIISLATAAAAASLTFAPAASAAPVACFGSPEIAETYLCIVRFKAGATPFPTGGNVHVPPLCAFVCTPPIDQDTPRVEVYQGEALVYYYAGNCYYFYGDGSYSTSSSSGPNGC